MSETFEEQVVRIIGEITSPKLCYKTGEIIEVFNASSAAQKQNMLVIDTGKAWWKFHGDAEDAANRLGTIFKMAGMTIHMQRGKYGTTQGYRPKLIVSLPSGRTHTMRELDEANGYIKLGGKAQKFIRTYS